jgi:glutathione S-transferase
MTYQLFIANKLYSSWSLRPWLVLKVLGIPFDEQVQPFAAGSAPNHEAFRRFSPTGRVPCLHDGELKVWDSLAITEYLAERHPGVWPQQASARAWARCAAAEMHSGFSALRQQCSMQLAYRIQMGAISPGLHADLNRLDELWCEGLARHGGPWLGGEAFTAVDAFFAPVAFRIQTFGLSLSGPAMAYAQRLLQLSAMKQWEQAALQEPWSDPAHDADSLAAGTLIQDLRENRAQRPGPG